MAELFAGSPTVWECASPPPNPRRRLKKRAIIRMETMVLESSDNARGSGSFSGDMQDHSTVWATNRQLRLRLRASRTHASFVFGASIALTHATLRTASSWAALALV